MIHKITTTSTIILGFLIFTVSSMADVIPVNLNFSADQIIIDEIDREGQIYAQLSFAPDIPKAHHQDFFLGVDSLNLPRFPCRNYIYAIPAGQMVTAITDLHYTEQNLAQLEEGRFVIPSQHPMPTLDGYAFEPFQHVNRNIYHNLTSFPWDTLIVKLIDGHGELENITLASIQVTPFKYYGYTGELNLLTDIGFNLRLEPAPSGDQHSMPGPTNPMEPLEIVYPSYLTYPEIDSKRQLIDNTLMQHQYSTPLKFVPPAEDRPWIFELIVIPDSSFIEPANELRKWRTDTHRPAKVFTLDQIALMCSDGDMPEKIRRVFRDHFYTYGTKALLMVGDDLDNVRYLYPGNTNNTPDIVNQHMANCLYLGEFTMSYHDWDFDQDGVFGEPKHDRPDLYSEGWVGIVPAETASEFQIYVDKIKQYESYGSGGSMLYVTTCVDQMRDMNQHEFYPECIPPYVYVDNYFLIEQPSGGDQFPLSPFGQTIIDYYKFNRPSFVNESSHGSPDYNTGKTRGYNMGPRSEVGATYRHDQATNPGCILDLEGSGCLMTMWTVSCFVAAYDCQTWWPYSPCMGEGYLFVEDGGCIIYNGHSRWGWVSNSKYMTREYWNRVFNTQSGHLAGLALRDTRLAYSDFRDENYTMNLYGDPTIAIFTDYPDEFMVTGPDTLNPGRLIFDEFIVTELDGSPVAEDVTICARWGEDYVLGHVDGDGYIRDAHGMYLRLEVSGEYESSENIHLTVSAWGSANHNFLVYQKEIIPRSDDSTGHISRDRRAINPNLPSVFRLAQNFPNPFNPTTSFDYDLPIDCHVRLEIYDLLGRKVAGLIDEDQRAGYHSLTFDASEQASGVYFYRLEAGNFSKIKSMVLLR